MSKVCRNLKLEDDVTCALTEFRIRSAGKRPKGRSYLIVCEGTKTEPNYFEALRKYLSGGEGDKIVVVGAQDNTLGLVSRARQEIESRNRSDNPPFYHVWLVFDRDSFPPDDFDNAIASTELEDKKFVANGSVFHPHWHAAWSNEAFELWYLFHFQENIGGGLSRERFKVLLSSHLGYEYQKNAPEMFTVLLPLLRQAIERARRSYERWSADVPCHKRNPATAVYQLVDALMSYV